MRQRSVPEDLSIPWLERDCKVLVVGDVMMDEYLEGSVEKISPEAPVPVHLVHKCFQSAGGAANVARNICGLGAKVTLVGIWGQDETAATLKELLTDEGVCLDYMVVDPNRPTIRKTRVTSNHQQLVRIDRETVLPLTTGLKDQLLTQVKALEFDVLLLSDYGKGSLSESFLAEVLEYCGASGVPVVVDPKGKDYHRYRGADLITPNWKEACLALGYDPLSRNHKPAEIAKELQKVYGLGAVALTLSADGIYFLPAADGGIEPFWERARAREVYDVSGAGDTVVATLALCWVSGYHPKRSVELANIAAGRVVEKWRTQPVFLDELKQLVEASVQRSAVQSHEKLLSVTTARQRVAGLQAAGRRVVFTNGCFDIIHRGHISYLEDARSRGDVLILGLNSDASVRKLKGPHRPVVPEEDRAMVLCALQSVDFVVMFDSLTPLGLIQELKPDVLVKGADYEISEIVGAQEVLSWGGQVARIPFVEGQSTTGIIDRITELATSSEV